MKGFEMHVLIGKEAIKKIIFILILFVFGFFTENAASEQIKKREYWPGKAWKTSSPEEQGMDSVKLLRADEFIQERLSDVFSLLIVKNGYLVFEKYYSWGDPSKIAPVHSITKSFTSALLGIALEEGYLHSADQKMIDFFPEYAAENLDPRVKEISLKHILMMSAGFSWNDRGPVMRAWYTSEDWAKFSIHLPFVTNPGDKFCYNSSISHLLSIILTKSTKTAALDFAKENLFKPLGIQSGFWQQGPKGYNIGGFGLGFTARDLARFGFLYLNNGYWNGKSIVPEKWVQQSTTQQIQAFSHPLYGAFGYGYQWWVKKVDGFRSFRAWGRRGQYIVVVPELDLVIVVTSNPALPHPPTSIHYNPLFDLVAASVQRNRPPKSPLKGVSLPDDLKIFLKSFDEAKFNKDVANMSEFISDNFLHNGVNKQMAVSFLFRNVSYIYDAKLLVTRFEQNDGKAEIDVWLKNKYYEILFMIGCKLIKESGNWRWFGNQNSSRQFSLK